jgi:hypothetical protein
MPDMEVVAARADLFIGQVTRKAGERDLKITDEVEPLRQIALVSTQPGIEYEQVGRPRTTSAERRDRHLGAGTYSTAAERRVSDWRDGISR